MTAPDLISYRHKDDHKNKTRFVQRKVDKVPKWAADVQPYTEPTTAPDLKPCRFCGERDSVYAQEGERTFEHYVGCRTCGLEMMNGETLADVITRWNAPTPLAEALAVPEVKALAVPEVIAGRSLSEWAEFARRDDCLDRMVPSDLRQLVAALRAIGKAAPDTEIPADAENGRATVSRMQKGDVS